MNIYIDPSDEFINNIKEWCRNNPLDIKECGHTTLPAWNKGIPTTTSQRKKQSLALKGVKKQPFTEKHKKNMSLAAIGKKRTFSEEHRKNLSKANKVSTQGRRWWTNGIINKMCIDCPGSDFYIGRIL